MKTNSANRADTVKHVHFTAEGLAAMATAERVKVAVEGAISKKAVFVMSDDDRSLYDFENAPGVEDTGHEPTDEEFSDILAGKAWMTLDGVRYHDKPKKTFHAVGIEAERERLRNARKLAEIADDLARMGIALNVPGRSIPTVSEIETVWLS